jgi:hypothetical protein
MSLDFGSPAIEIAVALSFVFFLLSVIATKITEGLARLVNLRSTNLENGIKGMVGDDGIADQVLNHPLVLSDTKPASGFRGKYKKWKRKPSYLSPDLFALAFLDVVSRQEGISGDSAKPVESVTQLAQSDRVNSNLGVQLESIVAEASTSPVRLRMGIEKWFDDSMQRVSGWYTRVARWITLFIAIALTLGLNASALRIADRLSEQPAVRAAVVAEAEKEVESSTKDEAAKNTEGAYSRLAALGLPILWAAENAPNEKEEWVEAIAGWLITILAISLGAPFWFDALNKLSNLRAAGKKPEEPGKT